MDIQRIIEVIKSEKSNARLFFTRKRGIRYISYSPEIESDLQETLKELIVDYLKQYNSIDQIEFSPLGYREETIETCNVEYISNFLDVINSYEDGIVNREIPKDIINNLNFYCLVIEYNENGEDKEIRLFRRVTKFKRLSTKGMMGSIKNNKFSKLDASLLGIDGDIDIVVAGDEVLILNHISLERIFSISNQYVERAQEAIDIIRDAGRVTNFEQFEEDALNDGRITRTLTKMLNEEERLERCFENFGNIINVIELFDLDINIQNENGVDKVVYEHKDQLMDIIRVVRDSYYTSIINNRRGIDDSI
ncbi:Kiwa anti-phage protein KwaB-like domain-containing protein [Clostridium paraputrificum]|uniref:Kiwa anti-phage protein KwaB-like domain-containing protein n=1 Tax=Clostridium paraputrificum TaxID=29363 RepID=UPI00374E2482